MDSYNYENLLPGNGTGNNPIATAVWNDFSFDGNDLIPETLTPTYWQQGAGGICRFQTRVCGWRQNGVVVSQNNWLFTQHISSDFDSNIYNYDVTIHVEAIYSFQSCREGQGCLQRFNLLHYMTNSQQLPSTSGNGCMNTQNYENFAVPEGPTSSETYTNTYSFTLPPSSTGFYIAVQDIGSCIALSRLRVYRNNCKSRQVGLVLYPDAPAPVSGSANIDTVVLRMQWSLEAQESHVAVMKRGVFKILCVGVIVAMSKIWGLQGAMVRITVRWSAPADLGGRTDLYYQVNRSDHEDPTSYTFTDFVSGTTTSYTFCSLRPNTQYCVRVTSHIGVSDQDPDGERLRTEGECTTRTSPNFLGVSTEGPGVVSGVQGTYPYVVWNPPEEPNGVITGYRLVFTRSGTSTTRTVTTTNDQTFYIIQSSDVPWTSGEFRVTVAAGNSVGFGTQSSTFALTIGDSTRPPPPPPNCPVCPAQSVGLVRYPATLASTSGPVTVTTQCADNAHVRTGSSLSVRCSSTGSWTGM
ncbi:Ephrin type-A receptor 5 [Geodia barretti]|uniref:Ephrin type-A receptor 5 n=1 Tax=Geodia barretti TaxID=519541 RepID=A0AA35X278_GEOBA|nr:Ephrin type-A receptor 5 [Geodia barretti]